MWVLLSHLFLIVIFNSEELQKRAKADSAGGYNMVGFSYGEESKSDEKETQQSSEDQFIPSSPVPESIPLVYLLHFFSFFILFILFAYFIHLLILFAYFMLFI